MPSDDSIARYIEVQRGREATTRTRPEDERTYRALWEVFTQSMAHVLDRQVEAELRVVSSLFARAETVHAADKSAVIYDEFIGTIFSDLTHLLDTVDNVRTPDYLQVLYARRLLIAGRAEDAYFMASKWNAVAQQMASRGLGSRHRIEILVQEAFVLSHELMHLLMSSSASDTEVLEALHWGTASAGARMLDSEGAPETSAAGAAAAAEFADAVMAERIAESLAPGFGAGVIDPDADDSKLYWLAAFERFQKPPSNLRILQQSLADPGLKQEVICDGLAVMLVVGQAEAFQLTAGQVLRSLHIALRNMGLVRFVDLLAVRGSSLSEDDRISFVEKTHVRALLFHALARAVVHSRQESRRAWRGNIPTLVVDETYKLVERAFNVVLGEHVFDDVKQRGLFASGAEGVSSRSSDLRARRSKSHALYEETFSLLWPG